MNSKLEISNSKLIKLVFCCGKRDKTIKTFRFAEEYLKECISIPNLLKQIYSIQNILRNDRPISFPSVKEKIPFNYLRKIKKSENLFSSQQREQSTYPINADRNKSQNLI